MKIIKITKRQERVREIDRERRESREREGGRETDREDMLTVTPLGYSPALTANRRLGWKCLALRNTIGVFYC